MVRVLAYAKYLCFRIIISPAEILSKIFSTDDINIVINVNSDNPGLTNVVTRSPHW